MALSKTKTLVVSGGAQAVAPDAYARVRMIHCDKNSGEVELSWFTAQGVQTPFLTEHFNFTVNLDGCNIIKQAYEHLKTLPEFSDAVDC